MPDPTRISRSPAHSLLPRRRFCRRLCLIFVAPQTSAMAVSVKYRLVLANPIPPAFEDAWTSLNGLNKYRLKYVVSESCDEWIKQYIYLRCIYIAGDSAGGNIVHDAAVRLGSKKLEGMMAPWSQDRQTRCSWS